MIQQSENNRGRLYKEEKDVQSQDFLLSLQPDSAQGNTSRGTRKGPQALHLLLDRKDTHQGMQWRKQGAWRAAPLVPELHLLLSKTVSFMGLRFPIWKMQTVTQKLSQPLSALLCHHKSVSVDPDILHIDI